jgi:hypothetical protein
MISGDCLLELMTPAHVRYERTTLTDYIWLYIAFQVARDWRKATASQPLTPQLPNDLRHSLTQHHRYLRDRKHAFIHHPRLAFVLLLKIQPEALRSLVEAPFCERVAEEDECGELRIGRHGFDALELMCSG